LLRSHVGLYSLEIHLRITALLPTVVEMLSGKAGSTPAGGIFIRYGVAATRTTLHRELLDRPQVTKKRL